MPAHIPPERSKVPLPPKVPLSPTAAPNTGWSQRRIARDAGQKRP